jgi:hypothetical protein
MVILLERITFYLRCFLLVPDGSQPFLLPLEKLVVHGWLSLWFQFLY